MMECRGMGAAKKGKKPVAMAKGKKVASKMAVGGGVKRKMKGKSC
jgi:hypothetical protein